MIPKCLCGAVMSWMAISNAVGDETSEVLLSLLGDWEVIDTTADGVRTSGQENWSTEIPGEMYRERYQAGDYSGTAVIWRASNGHWLGIWCDNQKGCADVGAPRFVSWRHLPTLEKPMTWLNAQVPRS